MSHSWTHGRAEKHILSRIADVEHVEVVDYTKDKSLDSIPVNKAYRVFGAHLYADITNIGDMLNCTAEEGLTCHRRTLRFLHLHQRAVKRVLDACDIKRVDFHNQRLHGVVIKPYNTDPDAEAKRIHKAVAVAQLMIDVLEETGDEDEHIANAKVRVGIDSGEALAVNNGRRNGREALFLGAPANLAAKLASGASKEGIYLTNNAREAIGLKAVDKTSSTALTRGEIEISQDKANLPASKDEIVAAWRVDFENTSINDFQFTRHTPPLEGLRFDELGPKTSRRQEAVNVYADLDGFTRFVSDNLAESAKDVVKVLHVVRAELDRVISKDFGGRRVRFIGDCVHGLLCEGTPQTTDVEETISVATLCAGALRSSFDLCLEKLEQDGVDVEGLGLAIGFEYGWMTATRLGVQGDRLRCSISRATYAAEGEQLRCNGQQTAIGQHAYDEGTDAVRKLFGSGRRISGLGYDEAVDGLADEGDQAAVAARKSALTSAAPAIQRAGEMSLRPHLDVADD
ncbi:adenylate/guanylate cyclase domain-containing protein [Mesorhizobium sp.]|uniref:adenylate/guanylate cyclase domain-containing protein n=1 Tax=Mesorhizobium sp. TaxID=1871066 RepID=UPI000FE7629F|nr:adenylate/guanylate cyclase domain-containing protein [Mesorhizobium sp.]RWG07846.1 MAG: transcriptional regulator [Mesorhizobium sp.]TIN47492.1 MAG: transcriptional regulator [Mesorhizobium sp.]TIR95555.1 MAG: transcriptional regulator [Mesorhizobium sp.]TIS03135.1 MAG: transcriptional regulator [Mesorhizobium sp.]